MTTLTTRSGKGSELVTSEVDTNWNNLNNDKYEKSGDTLTGPMEANDQEIKEAQLVDLSEKVTAPAVSSGTLTLDLATSNVFDVTLDQNVTTLSFANVPASNQASPITLTLTQDGTGSRTVSWPASVKWAGGSAPSLSTAAGAIDIIMLFTMDGGTTWFAFTGGLNMS